MTERSGTVRRDVTRSRWLLPGFSLAMGAALFGAATYGGHPTDGLWMFGVMALVAAGVLVASRWSETISGLSGPGRDERLEMIDLRATALSGLVIISAVIVGFLVELGRGHSGSPFGELGAIGGVAYVAAVVFFRTRG